MVTVVVLYILSAVLPIAGFARLLWRVQRRIGELYRVVAERGHSASTWDDFDAHHGRDIREPYREERRNLAWDLALVGAGLVAGAVASIWSLRL